MSGVKEFDNWNPPVISPEWELFRAVQQMSWQDLHERATDTPAGDTSATTCVHGLFDMYRSVELSLNLDKALASPKLSQLGEKHGSDLVCRLIGLTVLVYFNRLPVNSESAFGAWRLRQTSEWLYDTYYSESLRDLMYAFYRARGCHHHNILDVVTDYLEWRASKLEAIHLARSQATANPWPNDFKERLPERWFLGYLNPTHGNNSQEAA